MCRKQVEKLSSVLSTPTPALLRVLLGSVSIVYCFEFNIAQLASAENFQLRLYSWLHISSHLGFSFALPC
jgi:hypothetical protein